MTLLKQVFRARVPVCADGSAVLAGRGEGLPIMGCRRAVLGCLIALGASYALAAEPPEASENAPRSWAVIIVGLDGDQEHTALFNVTSSAWRQWLVDGLGFPADHVVLLRSAKKSANAHLNASGPATRDYLEATLQRLAGQLREQDRFWLLTLGHGNHDDRHTFLHLPGPDLDDQTLASWLDQVPCREQVLWLTHSASGWSIPALGKSGRIVITATEADAEFNATEFPHALATVTLRSQEQLDVDRDQSVSLLELLNAVVIETNRRFEADRRIPTEHAQLDDNGDGRPTEVVPGPPPHGEPAADAAREGPKPGEDGYHAASLRIPYRAREQPPANRERLVIPDSEDAPAP